MDAKSHVCNPDFFYFLFLVSTFDICCETSFVFPKLNRHFIFDLPLSVGNFLFSFFHGFHIAFLTGFFFLHAPSLGLLSFSSLSNVGLLF
jgi:hypothetical protein